MDVVAHRGCAGQYPENTVLAARESAREAGWVEIDLRHCADGIVVFHDDTLDRLTDGGGPVDETPLSELRKLRVLDTDQTIPTFPELLDAVPAETGFIAHVKESGIVADALRDVAEFPNDVWVLTGSDEVCQTALDTDVPTTVGGTNGTASPEELAAMADRGYEFVYSNFEHCATTSFVADAHDAGLAVNAGTIRTDEEAQHVPALRERDVELLSVDRLDFPTL
jgi:glycerophosphoryl diester phosphodiesterase